MDEDAVELPTEPHGSHVALDVLALWVERPADVEHARRQVDQHHLESVLEIRGVTAAAAAQLEHRSG